MPTLAFYKNYVQIIKAAQLCLEKDLHMPALILVFTLIDSFAWAVSAKAKRKNKEYFEAWVNDWITPTGNLTCTATELYAARCGVLHTLTSKAELNTVKSVRQVVYCWGPATIDTLQKSLEVIDRTDVVGLHINDLLEAVKSGMADTFYAAETDPALQLRLEEAAALHFSELPVNSLEKLMELYESGLKLP